MTTRIPALLEDAALLQAAAVWTSNFE